MSFSSYEADNKDDNKVEPRYNGEPRDWQGFFISRFFFIPRGARPTASQREFIIISLHDRRFMSQAGRTRYFARSARLRGRENESFIFSSPRLAPRARVACSPRLAHKAPVMQANNYNLSNVMYFRFMA